MGRPVLRRKSLRECVLDAQVIFVGLQGAEDSVLVREVMLAAPAGSLSPDERHIVEPCGTSLQRAIAASGTVPTYVAPVFEHPLKRPSLDILYVYLARWNADGRLELVAEGAVLPAERLAEVRRVVETSRSGPVSS
ncbi:MAG: hypothetical protein ACO3JL_14820 [Myxococcota bacterium]